MSTLVLRAASRVIWPLMVVLSIYLLVRGHDAVGGGFIAALVAGLAIALRYFAAEGNPISLSPLVVLGTGLGLAVASGLGGYALEGSFLGSLSLSWTLPIVGDVHVATSLIFDVGVYLVVIGLVLSIISSMGEDDG